MSSGAFCKVCDDACAGMGKSWAIFQCIENTESAIVHFQCFDQYYLFVSQLWVSSFLELCKVQEFYDWCQTEIHQPFGIWLVQNYPEYQVKLLDCCNVKTNFNLSYVVEQNKASSGWYGI